MWKIGAKVLVKSWKSPGNLSMLKVETLNFVSNLREKYQATFRRYSS